MGGESASAVPVIDLGSMSAAFPLRDVELILAETNRASQRKRKLPAELMTYYVIALGLLASVGARRSAVCSAAIEPAPDGQVSWRAKRPSPRRDSDSEPSRYGVCTKSMCAQSLDARSGARGMRRGGWSRSTPRLCACSTLLRMSSDSGVHGLRGQERLNRLVGMRCRTQM